MVTDIEITCSSCDAVSDLNEAVEGGEWVPYYWDEHDCEEVGATCPACVERLGIVFGDDGEFYRPGGV